MRHNKGTTAGYMHAMNCSQVFLVKMSAPSLIDDSIVRRNVVVPQLTMRATIAQILSAKAAERAQKEAHNRAV